MATDGFGVGDVLGWFGVITLFVLVWTLIRYLWKRGKPPKAGSDNWFQYVMDRIAELDTKIKTLLAAIEELKRQRDDLKRQARDYVKLRDEIEIADVVNPIPEPPLLVIIGSDAKLKLDLAALRAVETETGMGFQRIEDASLEEIKRRLDLARSYGRPFNKIHMAVHASSSGIELGGILIDSVSLSEILRDVKVLVIAGCDSSYIGTFLGVVPYVISLNEKITHTDAAIFARAFWTQIGKKVEPTVALREALKRSPSGLSEYIERHW